MKKNILVIYYSQTGQLEDIVRNIAKPFEAKKEEYDVTYYNIKLRKDFPFPWPGDVFFNTFPESYLQIPQEIFPPSEEILNKKYDLILFGYQVWYLTPSIPIISFLKSGYAGHILKDTPVVTISGTRNMWMLSQEKLKVYLRDLKAQLVGNIALVDRHDNYTSVLTILRWLTTGQKEKSGMLPAAGISDEEISGSVKYGEINLIIKKKEKRPLLIKFFKVYLMAAIWIISPVVLVLHLLTTPIFWFKRQKQKRYLQGINLK
ncbi:dialkylresorcinol condensing enzyme DarA [Chryseobacterium indologenes]|uniref:dialkylrecorsinol condensing enzyme DarA n=1 Tax=Chryseobacterium indologenes TaxID=253 RepID=UPI000F50498C|nr:dialkylrecorsinol condensing enzyme DarA [Chryseobacterium indologenes]AYZ34119.1 dialkylresorcinol condensing enzyme DarA [Chryseobacterium indologenes]